MPKQNQTAGCLLFVLLFVMLAASAGVAMVAGWVAGIVWAGGWVAGSAGLLLFAALLPDRDIRG